MKSALLRLHAAIFLWGFTGVLGRMITLNAGWLVWWRMLITVVSLWLLLGAFGKIKKITLRDWLKISSIGFVLALHFLCFYSSIKYSNISIALTCLAFSGILSALIEPIVFRKKIDPLELVLGAFALIGIVIIYFTNLKFSVGIYIGLAAALLTVMVSVLNKKIVNGYDASTIVLHQVTGGFIGLTLLMPLYHHIVPTAQIFPALWDWVWLLVLSWLCTIVTFFLHLSALKKVSAFTANLTLTLEPVYGIILAFIIYKENEYLSDYFYIGFGLILMAVILQMRRIVRASGRVNIVGVVQH